MIKFHEFVGPFTMVVSNAHLAPDAMVALEPILSTSSHLIVVTEPSSKVLGALPFKTCVSEGELAVTEAEALELAGGTCPAKAAMEHLVASGGQYVPFQVAMRGRRGLPPLIIPEPGGATFEGTDVVGVDPSRMVDALLQRGAACEALELALRIGLSLESDLVDKAGQHFFDRGLHKRLFNLLRALTEPIRHQNEQVMKWYFSAATATNNHTSVRAEIQEYLIAREAPELRALYAAAFPGPDLLLESKRALRALESPTTLRIHAFALSQIVGGDEGVAYLLRALRQSQALGLQDLVVACATDLSDYRAKRGAYGDSAEWARWGLDWHVTHSLRDEVRRLLAISLSCFARMLIGDTLGLQSAVEELDVSISGIPTSESAVSTLGDWHFLNGEIKDSVEMYRLNVVAASLGQFHHAVVDLVHALVHRGAVREAQGLAARAVALTRHGNPVDKAIGALASGLALAESAPVTSMRDLEAAQAILTRRVEATRLAQASIALARLRLRHGDESGARASLAVGEPALTELGFTGWTLLGGFDPEVKALYQMFHGRSTDLELHFLGSERIHFKGGVTELGLRQCECLVVLASKPEGVTAERLGVDVYGESALLSTLKAIVSRLRQVIPIENRPYRIGVSFWADFVELEHLIAVGRVREAMSLYHGPLLPRSQAPSVVELREHLDESIRRAVLRSGDIEALLQLAKMSEMDLELYEAALERLSANDPRFPIVRSKLEHVRRSWQQA